jgi:RpiB/LacA/LacB family sugar-phosphate isomerase
MQKICVAGDHAGFELKEAVKRHLAGKGFDVHDCGALAYDKGDDYPVFAKALAAKVAGGECPRGVLFCGTGVGASIAANRRVGVRAALCFTPEMGALSRSHNDANVLVLGSRINPEATSIAILDAWLVGRFEGGRHKKRNDMLDEEG